MEAVNRKKKKNCSQIEDLNLHLNKNSLWSRDSKPAYDGVYPSV